MTVNGQGQRLDAAPSARLLDVLRDQLALTGTKRGCETGHCGACSVLLDGDLVCSCTTLALECEGAVVTTIEGVQGQPEVQAYQRALVDTDAFQCGYCTPGFVMAVVALLAEHADPSAPQVRSALAGNLCRCTGYTGYVEAACQAATAAADGATS